MIRMSRLERVAAAYVIIIFTTPELFVEEFGKHDSFPLSNKVQQTRRDYQIGRTLSN